MARLRRPRGQTLVPEIGSGRALSAVSRFHAHQSTVKQGKGSVAGLGAISTKGVVEHEGVSVPPFAQLKTTYDSTVSTKAEIETAMAASGNAGKTIAIKGGTYAKLTCEGSSGSLKGPASLVTFIAFPGEKVTIAGVKFRFARNIRFEGIKWSGEVLIEEANTGTRNTNLQFYGCESAEYVGSAYYLRPWTKNVTIEGCYIHDMKAERTENPEDGYAIRCTGGAGSNEEIKVKQCKIEYIGNDVFQISSTSGFEIDRCEWSNWNRYLNARSGTTTTAHPDGCQAFGGTNLTISNSYMHDGGIEQGVFMEQGYAGLHINNCYFTGAGTYGLVMQSGAGAGSATGSTNVIVENTTIWGNGIAFTKNTDHAANQTLRNCLYDGINMLNGATWTTEENNKNGGTPVFNSNHESTAYTQGYRKPTEIWW